MPQQASSADRAAAEPRLRARRGRASAGRARRSSARFMRSYGPAMRSNMRSTSAGSRRSRRHGARSPPRAWPQRRSRSCSTPSRSSALPATKSRRRRRASRAACRRRAWPAAISAPAWRSVSSTSQVDRRERRLARHEHEPAILLERHAGRPVDQVRLTGATRSSRPSPSSTGRSRSRRSWPSPRRRARTSRARAYSVACGPPCSATRRSHGLGGIERAVAVELVGDDLARRGRGAHADLGARVAQAVEDPCRIGRAGRARDAEEEAHAAGSPGRRLSARAATCTCAQANWDALCSASAGDDGEPPSRRCLCPAVRDSVATNVAMHLIFAWSKLCP